MTAIGAILLGILAYGLGDGRMALVIVAAAGCTCCLTAYVLVGRLMPRYYTARLLTVGYGTQLFALFATAVLGLPLVPPYHPFDVNLGEAPFRTVAAMLTVPVGVLLAALGCWAVSRPVHALAIRPLQHSAGERRVYLVIAAAS